MTTTSAKRLAKRVRFAVLSRDGHTCQYCGSSAPDVRLQVDHVVPTALGGSDDPTNLVTACEACNSGKASTSPTEERVAGVADTAMAWGRAMQHAAQEIRTDRDQLHRQLDAWAERWNAWEYTDGTTVPLPSDWRTSLAALLEAGCDQDALIAFIAVAMEAKPKDTFRYFCGCCWNHVRHLQARAHQLIAGGGTARPPNPAPDWSDETTDEAYAMGVLEGYAEGHQAGWETGLAAGRATAADRESTPSPLSLHEVLQQAVATRRPPEPDGGGAG